MTLGRFVACALTVFFCMAVGSVTFAAKGIYGSPNLANAYLDWQLRAEDLPSLARWDLVILDADQQRYSPQHLRTLKELNPSIKLLAYISSSEIARARFAESPDFPAGNLASRIQDAWYVHDPSGHEVSFWPESPILNVTDLGPASPSGQRWSDFLPRFIQDEILATGLWDGIFLDNTQDSITRFAKSPVDLDRDGRADDAASADRAWRAGMATLLRNIRAANPNAIFIGNGGYSFSDILNGVFFEQFPSYTWAANWKDIRTAIGRNLPPSYTIVNVNTNDADRPDDYRRMRYGLANALVAGGYYSFDRGAMGHNVLWWYDEYEATLGKPRASPRPLAAGRGSLIVPAVWAREFQHGIAMFNSTDAAKRVSLPGEFEKLRGVQDSATNDGTLVRVIDLASHDGLLLFRRSAPEEIRGSAFRNGDFLRLYDTRGRQERSGFFAQRKDAPSGVMIVAADVDGDGALDLVTAHRGVLSIRFAENGTTLLRPFGSSYTGRLSLAAGNTNRDAPLEMIVGRDGAAPPEVKIFSRTGGVLARWDAYAHTFTGGVRVGVGDLDGDGRQEIVTAAGPGGGPHIRVWKTDGTVWGGGWFAFDANARGGVQIAVGDLDGDGKDEIIVASGHGAIPRVRIFDGRGTLKGDFTLGNRPLAEGLRVAVSDVNGDGKKEILIGGLPIF
ncbi:MAG: putative glycoside hydrolase [Patescibacteria group bacterium]